MVACLQEVPILYSDLTGKLLDFGKLIAEERWSKLEVLLYWQAIHFKQRIFTQVIVVSHCS